MDLSLLPACQLPSWPSPVPALGPGLDQKAQSPPCLTLEELPSQERKTMARRPTFKGHRKQVRFISAAVMIQPRVFRMLGKCSAVEHSPCPEHNFQTQERHSSMWKAPPGHQRGCGPESSRAGEEGRTGTAQGDGHWVGLGRLAWLAGAPSGVGSMRESKGGRGGCCWLWSKHLSG